MKQYEYHGTYGQYSGRACVITHLFLNTSDRIGVNPTLEEARDDEKYTVMFDDGSTVNVYGRNLKKIMSKVQLSLKDRFMYWLKVDYDEEPKEHNIVVVNFHGGHNPGKKYSYLNPGLKLKRGMHVVVEARDFFNVATIVDFHETSRTATKYVVQIVDTDQVAKMREVQQRKKDLNNMIKLRVAVLREEMEVQLLAKEDGELQALLNELSELNNGE